MKKPFSIPRALLSFLPSLFPFLSLLAATFELNGRAFTLPDGLEIEAVAGSPLVDRPIVADFDERGGLFVADSSGSSAKGEEQLKTRPHRIVRLEDTDGDGRFDRSTVFADRMMFPEGILCSGGSVYCGAPPSIWKLTDRDGDGVADERIEWFNGKTLTGCANDLHGPYAGPDGWIYWCKGAFAQQTHERPGKSPLVTRAAHIFRCRPDGSGIEAVMTGGMDNPVEVAFSRGGERFLTSTFLQQPGGGKRDGLIHAVYGGVYGKVNDVVDGHPRTGELLPAMTHLGPAVPSGLCRYEEARGGGSSDGARAETAGLGAGFQGNLFAALFNLHKVTRHVLEEDGATFHTRDSDLVASDHPDFHPTDVLEDADGSLLVIDTGGWYKICCPSSQLHKPDVLGAIYRVRRKGAPRIADPRGLKIAWDSSSLAEIADHLGDGRPAVRERAVRELASRGEAAVGPLAAALPGEKSSDARLGAVWALARIDGAAAREAARLALADGDPDVRQAAIHTASLRRDAGALPSLLEIVASGSPHARRAAAEAIGRIGDRSAVPPLLAALSEKRDRTLEHSLTFALIEIGERESVAAGLRAASPHARRASLLALDQMPGGGLKSEEVTPLLASSEPVLKETAVWIAARHSDWGGAVAGFLKERLAAERLSATDREELERFLARFAGDPAVAELIGASLPSASGGDSPRREASLSALRALARSGLKEAPRAWTAGIVHCIEGSDGELRRAALAAARALPPAKRDAAELKQALWKVAENGAAGDEARLEALAALPGGPGALGREIFEFLRARLDPSRPVPERAAAAGVLLRAKLEREQLLALAGALETAGPMEVSRLLEAFAAGADEEVGRKLVASLKSSAGLTGLRADSLKTVLAKFSPAIQKEGEELIDTLNVDAAHERSHLEELIKILPKGEVRRGQMIFNSTKAACSTCHAIGYLGGNLGPDLTKIGQVRTERDLLESIVYPSVSFVRSFEPTLVITKGGEAVSGLPKKDAEDEIILATGPTTDVRIPRGEIAEVRPGVVSVMPQGLEEQLTRQELADLVAFLKNTQW